MTLQELSREYLKEEAKLTRQIDSYLPYAKTLSGEQKHEAYRRLSCLYEMRRDVRTTAAALSKYYENKATRRVYHKNGQYFSANS